MNANTPKSPSAELEDDLDDGWQAVTGVRRRVRDIDSYPPRPERLAYFEKHPESRLDYDVEAQVDQWADKKILKAAIVLGEDPTKTAIVESTLNQCQTSGKIRRFDVSTDEDGKTVFTVYYKYTHAS